MPPSRNTANSVGRRTWATTLVIRPLRRSQHAVRAGVVLLEVLVALVLIATAGTAVIALVLQTENTVQRARAAERRATRAHAFLQAVALWSAAELDLRLGTRPQGPYRLHVLRPVSGVYVIALADSLAPTVPLLETVLYRSGVTDTVPSSAPAAH